MNAVTRFLTSRFPGPLKAWWNFRRKRFWVVVAVVCYTLAGFFLLPWIADQQLRKFVENKLQLELQLDKVYFNPWTLTAELRGLSINEDADTPLVAFDLFHVNVQTSSLFRWALTLKELRLERPFADLTIGEDGSINLSQLVPPPSEEDTAVEPEQAPVEETEEEGSLPRLLVQQLTIAQTQLSVTDASRPTTFHTDIGPIDINLTELNTLPERNGQYSISLLIGDQTRIDWQGNIALNPLSSHGQLSASGDYLQLAHQYLQDQLNFDLSEGELSLELQYDVASGSEGLTAAVNNAELSISDLQLSQAGVDDAPVEIVNLPRLHVAGIGYQWPANTLNINSVTLDDATLEAWMSPQGAINFTELVVPAEEDSEQPPASDASPFEVSLSDFSINNLAADFTDYSVGANARAGIRQLDFSLSDISNQPNASFPLSLGLSLEEGGRLTASGSVSVLPEVLLELTSTAEAIPLIAAQPWISPIARLELREGEFNHQLEIQHNPEQLLHATGSMSVSQLEVNKVSDEEYLSGWENFDIDRFDLDLTGQKLDISEITLLRPYGRIIINEDRSTNLQDILVTDAEDVAKETAAEGTAGEEAATTEEAAATADGDSAPFAVNVSRINIEEAATDFSDLSLPLPFATHIANLSGTIDSLSTTSSEPASVNLEGDVDEYGLARIEGQLLPMDPTAQLDLNVLFRNVELSNVTPYTVEFVGREIDSGKLELDLQYQVDNNQLVGQNSILIDELTLGDRVDSPNAVDLPLGLAVALLKKADGTIDIDLEVSGDINDPAFNVGAVVWDTFVNLITRAATAPFRLLGGLVGAGSEDIGEISFLPGQSTLAPPEREKLDKLSEALLQRPELNVLVAAVISPEADAQTIREQRVEQAIEMRMAELGDSDAPRNERRRQALEALAEENLELDLELLEEQHQQPENPQEPEGDTVLDEPAYAAAIEELLISNETVEEEALGALANDRAAAIQAALLMSGELAESRISLSSETVESELNEADSIPLKLELVAD